MGATIERRDAMRLGATDICYVFKRVPRRRNVHILVNDEGVIEVRAPWRFSLSKARALLCENGDWVLQTLDSVQQRLAQRPRLITGARLPLLDESLRLDVRPRPRIDLFDGAPPRRGRVERRGMLLRVITASLGDGEHGELRALIERWYRHEAATYLAGRVEHYSPWLGVRPSKVTIRGQRSRWGSCSGKGTVSLNWRLMMVPGALADYVVVHELCHLRHMNHSPRFWAMVSGIIPDYRHCRRSLDALQGRLPL